MINREDMLELTRRMTPSRSCFTRIAGAYVSRDGEIEDTFNVQFRKLKGSDMTKNLAIAKTIPFSRTNDQLKEYVYPESRMVPGSMWQLLSGMHACGLKNDLLMEVFYEQIAKAYRAAGNYAIAVFHGTYDIPRKGSDNAYQYESEEVYDFLIGAVCPLVGEYEMGKPDFGFLFPAFCDRSAAENAIDIYHLNPEAPQKEAQRVLLA